MRASMTSGWLTFAFLGVLAVPVEGAPDSRLATGLVPGINGFTFDLYARLAVTPGDVCVSPFSVHDALAMTYTGARRTTATEMARAMRYPAGPDELGTLYAGLLRDLLTTPPGVDSSARSRLAIANGFWGNPHWRIRPEFVRGIERDYGGHIGWLDFARRQPACDTINAWVADATLGLIRELVDPGMLDGNTVSVLANAIYFRGIWETPFSLTATHPAVFHRAAGDSIRVETMSQRQAADYTETADLQFLVLPYADRRLEMVLILPRRVDGLRAVEESLDADRVLGWRTRVEARDVQVWLPRFTFRTTFDLRPSLAAMGMPEAFGLHADFSGLTPERPAFISAVVHQAFVAVDELGTEAAAATAVLHTRGGRGVSLAPPISFRADHPFVFLIRDRTTGAILFIGRVSDPS